MNRKHLFTFALTLFISIISSAQNENSKKNTGLKINEILFFSGLSYENQTYFPNSTYQNLTKGSHIIPQSMKQNMLSFMNPRTVTNSIGFLLTSDVNHLPKLNPKIRYGFNFCSSDLFQKNNYSFNQSRYDTLYSNKTGEPIYVDTTRHDLISMHYNLKKIQLDFSYTIQTNPTKRISFFTGIGISTGLSFAANTKIYYSSYRSSAFSYNQGNTETIYSYTTDENSVELSEKIKFKSSINATFYSPIGCNFRLGREDHFWNKLQLVYEMRPSLYIYQIPEIGFYHQANVQHNLGIKYSF